MRNKLSDLNDHLFAQLERLGDEDITDEKLKNELARAKAISGVSANIINGAKLKLEAIKVMSKGNVDKNDMPLMLTDTK